MYSDDNNNKKYKKKIIQHTHDALVTIKFQ